MHLLPKVFRTEGDWAEFDTSKILESIISETGMKEEDAKQITELVARRIISSGLKFLSGPHIREIVCSILSEQHFEDERKLYTRIGMPLMDYEEILEKGPKDKTQQVINPEKIHHWAANQLAEEYTLLRILKDEESKAHLYGDIHIHRLKFFDLRPLSQTWDPRMILKYGLPPIKNWTLTCRSDPAENLGEAAHHLTKWLAMTQGEFSGSQGFNFINTYLAPYAKGLDENELKHAMQNLVYEINQLGAIIGSDLPITSISYSPDVMDFLSEVSAIGPKGVIMGKYGEFRAECLHLFDIINEIYIKTAQNTTYLTYPKQIIFIDKNWLSSFNDSYDYVWNHLNVGESPYFMNLCSDWLIDELNHHYKGEDIHNFGTLQNISLNLPRYAYLSRNREQFIEIIKEKMTLCAEIFKKKYKIIKKRLISKHLPLCSGYINNDVLLFDLQKQNLAFNIVGLNEAVKYLINHELHETIEAYDFGKRILIEMKKYLKELNNADGINYIIQENLSKKVMYRFAKLDLKHFSDKAIPHSYQGHWYYSNSAHFNYKSNIDLKERFAKQGGYNKIMHNGRNIKVASLEQIADQNYDKSEIIKHICEKTNVACVKIEKNLAI
jgi:ribonucleoside-triphosphate reductase